MDEKQLASQLSELDGSGWARLVHEVRLFSAVGVTRNTLLMGLHKFHGLFCFQFRTNDDLINRMLLLYPDMTQLLDKKKEWVNLYTEMYMALERGGLLDTNTETGMVVHQKMGDLVYQIKMMSDLACRFFVARESDDQFIRNQAGIIDPTLVFQDPDTSKKNPTQELVWYIWKKCQEMDLRKKGARLFKPRKIGGRFMYCYEDMCTIEEFVYSLFYPIQLNSQWIHHLTSGPNIAQNVASHLEKVDSEYLPTLETQRYMHAWLNGIFDLMQNRFFLWEQIQDHKIVASVFHNMNFDVVGMEVEMTNNGQDEPHHARIRIPPLERIMNSQHFTVEETMFIMGFVGRLLFELKLLDKWDLFTIFIGEAGTGKSTLLRFLATLLNPADVGYLSNKVEKNFPLAAVYDKLLVLCLDIDRAWDLDAATWQSMVSGEELQVYIKNKDAFVWRWITPFAAATNQALAFSNNSGSVERRLATVPFDFKIPKEDVITGLHQDLGQNKDRFLKLAVSCYHDLVRKYENADIHAHIPDRFKEARDTALKENNPFMCFIQDTFEMNPEPSNPKVEYTVEYTDMKAAFKEYCSLRSIRVRNDGRNEKNILAKFQVKIEEGGNGDSLGKKTKYLSGMKFRSN